MVAPDLNLSHVQHVLSRNLRDERLRHGSEAACSFCSRWTDGQVTALSTLCASSKCEKHHGRVYVMFRNPRKSASEASAAILPSIGQAPTPPPLNHTRSPAAAKMFTMTSSATPLVGKSKPLAKKASPIAAGGKGKGKSNGNIMNFFKRADSIATGGNGTRNEEEELFVQSSPLKISSSGTTQTPTPPRDASSNEDSPPAGEAEAMWTGSITSRFNEDASPAKRRKIRSEPTAPADVTTVEANVSKKGPFLDDSDSEREDLEDGIVGPTAAKDTMQPLETTAGDALTPGPVLLEVMTSKPIKPLGNSILCKTPSLKRESTSVGEGGDFDGMGDFIDDEFAEEGEEYLERVWMEEQAQLEMGLEDDGDEGPQSKANSENGIAVMSQEAGAAPCPICGGDIAELSEEEVSIHVNDCIDGKSKPLPVKQSAHEVTSTAHSAKSEVEVPGHKRFQRAAIAKPGQDNPFSFTATSGNTSSAFGKLMSGNAEDNAWATAAASEAASRGKPAYQRTCPFYKIMPGFFICVDAFRYGAVQGCNAYFLSHFHSDHYIGLTSSWCHGPIYCSHVTANLVRRQLRVDSKWVVDLEFEKKTEVPNTQGVDVTMIPANHCPGSSLFLFEKVVGKGKIPKLQRVLHCGDFRACPAHIQHPKLRPDITDLVTKRTVGQQKLDVCYLDTTYLTPKYAFPSQEEVIKACGDMCISLSKDFVDDDDTWEQTKRERAGSGMVKFVRRNSFKEDDSPMMGEVAPLKIEEPITGKAGNSTKIKIEDEDNDANFRVKSGEKKQKPRGRLLVVVGTYSIGKERICIGVAKALRSKIYAPPNKQKICAALEDPELSALMTDDPLEAQVHMQMLMEIRAETLADYLTGFKPHFSRIVGFRPSGWNYRPPSSRFTESPAVQTVLNSNNWKSHYSMAELIPQRGSTRDANCFGVPYSEHSSFRELTMFCCALRIDKIIPTVNVGSAKSREKMKAWCEKWALDKKKNGLFKVEDGQTAW